MIFTGVSHPGERSALDPSADADADFGTIGRSGPASYRPEFYSGIGADKGTYAARGDSSAAVTAFDHP